MAKASDPGSSSAYCVYASWEIRPVDGPAGRSEPSSFIRPPGKAVPPCAPRPCPDSKTGRHTMTPSNARLPNSVGLVMGSEYTRAGWSDLHPILADDARAAEVSPSRINPHLVGDRRIIGR